MVNQIYFDRYKLENTARENSSYLEMVVGGFNSAISAINTLENTVLTLEQRVKQLEFEKEMLNKLKQ